MSVLKKKLPYYTGSFKFDQGVPIELNNNIWINQPKYNYN